MPGVGRLITTAVVACGLVGGVVAAEQIRAGSSVHGGLPAERGAASQATEPVAAAARCGRVVVIGDSLMDNARPWLLDGLAGGGYDFHVDAHHSREIGSRRAAPYSGVAAVRAVRAGFGEADCWVIALGSNDLLHFGGSLDGAGGLIDQLLAELTPEARVWWVNVDFHRDPRYPWIPYPQLTAMFNAAVEARAASGRLVVIDWYTHAESNPTWFFDPVHVDRAGSIARARQTVVALG